MSRGTDRVQVGTRGFIHRHVFGSGTEARGGISMASCRRSHYVSGPFMARSPRARYARMLSPPYTPPYLKSRTFLLHPRLRAGRPSLVLPVDSRMTARTWYSYYAPQCVDLHTFPKPFFQPRLTFVAYR